MGRPQWQEAPTLGSFSKMAALPIQQGGLVVPCIRMGLMTMTATAVEGCADTASSRYLMIDGFLWDTNESIPAHIMPWWTEAKYRKYCATL